jgi:hypothetical protein
MTTRHLAIGGVTLAALSVGGTAFAYPPCTNLQVSGVQVGQPKHHKQKIIATVTNAEPDCVLRVRIGDTVVKTQANDDGVATAYAVVSGSRRVVIRVTTTRHGCSTHETASTVVSAHRAHVEGPRWVHRGEHFTVHASGFHRGHITFTARRIGSDDCVTFSRGWVDRSGNADQSIRLFRRGLWVIVASGSGDSDSTYVRVG